MNDIPNPQLSDIYQALIEMSKEQGESKARGEAIIGHLERINGTLDTHAQDIQTLKTADAITKAATVKFRWFLGVLIPVLALATGVYLKLG